MKRAQLTHQVVDVTPEQKTAREVVKLIRKLRWIGLEREAEQLQTVLGGFSSDKRASPLALIAPIRPPKGCRGCCWLANCP